MRQVQREGAARDEDEERPLRPCRVIAESYPQRLSFTPLRVLPVLGDLLVNVGCIFPAPLAAPPATFLAYMSTELVLLAAVAMLLPFAVQGQADVGVQASAQKLLPDNSCHT